MHYSEGAGAGCGVRRGLRFCAQITGESYYHRSRKLGSRGISLEKVSYRNIGVDHAKHGCFGRLTVKATCCTRNFFKKPCAIGEILIFTCFGPVLYEGSMEGV